MAKTGIFYGSTTGYTADVANKLAKALSVDLADVHDVTSTVPSALGDYDTILLGCSTWGDGDMQDDFADFLDGIEELDLTGKRIAIFGCGDESYSQTFGAAMGEIYKRMQQTGATFVAPFNLDGYSYDESPAIIDGQCVGLLIDEVNHPELVDDKIAQWVKMI